MNPCEDVRRTPPDQRAGCGIGPCVVNLPPHRKVAERGTPAEQVRPAGEMRLEESERIAEGLFDQRCVLRIRADKPYAIDHPLPYLSRHPGEQIFVTTRHQLVRDASGGRDLIDLARPSVVEHPLVAQFVAELLE